MRRVVVNESNDGAAGPLVDVEERRGYLMVRVAGKVLVEDHIDLIAARMREAGDATGTRKLLLDGRALTIPFPDDACHRAWEWLHEKRYDQLACVLPESAELLTTRINMAAISGVLPLRAFTTTLEAHRWLDLRLSGVHRKPSTSMLPAVREPNPSLPPTSDPPSNRRSGAFPVSSHPPPLDAPNAAPVRTKRASDPDRRS